MTTGEKIKAARKEKGLTQKALGELCGMCQVQIRRYELGIVTPKISTIERIAKALDVDSYYLLDIEFDRTMAIEQFLDKELKQELDVWAKLLNMSVADCFDMFLSDGLKVIEEILRKRVEAFSPPLGKQGWA